MLVKKTFFFFKSNKSNLVLLLYHLFFVYLAYIIRVEKGHSDAHHYWGIGYEIKSYPWSHFFSFGTDFMIALNYPMIVYDFPFWFGFLLYGLIGFYGIILYMKWAKVILENRIKIGSYNFFPVLFYLPNLHVWTANLGKESLIFLALAGIAYSSLCFKKRWYYALLGAFLLFIIRPHVALMLSLACFLVLVFSNRITFKNKIIGLLSVSFFIFTTLYYSLQLLRVRTFSWDKIMSRNAHSLADFKRYGGSFVPMQDYSYFFKWFSFNFRPLFFDAKSFLQIIASVENLFMLLLVVVTLILYLRYFKFINLMFWHHIIIAFAFVSTVIYAERYANLGIFMRTKVQYFPFLLIVCFSILFQIKSKFFSTFSHET